MPVVGFIEGIPHSVIAVLVRPAICDGPYLDCLAIELEATNLLARRVERRFAVHDLGMTITIHRVNVAVVPSLNRVSRRGYTAAQEAVTVASASRLVSAGNSISAMFLTSRPVSFPNIRVRVAVIDHRIVLAGNLASTSGVTRKARQASIH